MSIIAAIRAIIRLEFPSLRFYGIYSYTVQAVNGSRVDVAPTDTTLGLPAIPGLTLEPSILGEQVSGAQVGAVAIVQFVNGDRKRPEVVSLSLPSKDVTIDATGTLSLAPSGNVQLAGGTAPIARQGDAVTVYLGTTPIAVTGTITPSSIPGVATFAGTIAFLGPAVGIIPAGNPKAQA